MTRRSIGSLVLAVAATVLLCGVVQAAQVWILSCSVSGDAEVAGMLEQYLCDDFKTALESDGRAVAIVQGAVPDGQKWLRLEAEASNPYTVKALLSWGKGVEQIGVSAPIEAGISDAPISRSTVQFIAQSLLTYLP